MTNSGTWSTSTSLLNRIKQNDPQAWERFTHVYTPLVYTWGRRQGLNQQDAGDLVQDVFTRVFQYIQSFEPDNFRGWLWMVTRNQIHKMAGQNPRNLTGLRWQPGIRSIERIACRSRIKCTP
jgi:RNA polymerase sigma factor (sigma-70 family)